MVQLTSSTVFKLILVVLACLSSSAAAFPALSGAQNQAPGSSPDPVEVHIGKGYKSVKDRRFTEAAGEFQAALDLNPHLDRIRYQLAVCWFNVNQLKRSREEFERLRREAGGEASVAYYLGRIDLLESNPRSAIHELRSIVGTRPYADTYYQLGLAYLYLNDFGSSKLWLQRAAKATPRDPRVHEQLARLYQDLKEQREAEEEYGLASQLRRRLDEVAKLEVECDHDLENRPLADAEKTCRQLLDPSDDYNLLTLGVLYGRHGHFEQAVEPLLLAAKLDPESVEIQYNLGLTWFRLRRYREARAPLEKALALQPDLFGPTALLGATLYALKEDELSYRVLMHAHNLDPGHAETTRQLFRVAITLGQSELTAKKFARSLGFLEEAAALNPASPEVHRLLAEVYSSLGREKEAESEVQEAERFEQAKPR